MEQFTPRFNKREVVVRLPKTNNAFEQTREVVAEVVFVGEKAEYYKPGDTVLFQKRGDTELKYFNDNLWRIEHEDHVICKLERVENDNSL
jgi:hypothetical protein